MVTAAQYITWISRHQRTLKCLATSRHARPLCPPSRRRLSGTRQAGVSSSAGAWPRETSAQTSSGGNLWRSQVVCVGVDDEFERVVTARYDALCRAAMVLCGDRGHAEDLVQTTLANVHRSWRRVGAAEDVDAYLHRSLINVYRTWWRRSWHGERPSASLPDQGVEVDPTATVDLRQALLRALGRLPSGQREVLALRYLASFTEAETAQALGCSIGTVKSRTSRALAALRSSGLLHDTHARTP